MACEQWREQLDAYADGQLDSTQANVLAKHFPPGAINKNELPNKLVVM